MEKLCNIIDALLTAPARRLWMIVPYIHTDSEDSWVSHFLKRLSQKARAGCDLKIVLRPESCNQPTIQQLATAHIEVISPKNLPLYQKMIVSDNAVVRMETNLTDKELISSRGCNISTSPEDIESAFQWFGVFETTLSGAPSRTERELLPIKELVPEEFLSWIEGIDLVSSRQASIIQQILRTSDGLLITDTNLADRMTLITIAVGKELMGKGKVLHLSPSRRDIGISYDFYRRFEVKGCKVRRIIGEEKVDFLQSALNPDILLSSPHNFLKLLCSQFPQSVAAGSFLKGIGLVIIDGIERLTDPEQGRELELVLSRLEDLPDGRRIIFGNNIANAKEIASWLKAKLSRLASSKRPLFTEVVPYETSQQWYQIQIAKNEKIQSILKEILPLKKKIAIVVDNRKAGFQLGWQLYQNFSFVKEAGKVLVGNLAPTVRKLLKKGIGICSQDLDDAQIIRTFNKGQLPILIVTSFRQCGRIDCDCIIIRDVPENPLRLFDLLKLASGHAYILSSVKQGEEIQRNLQVGINISSSLLENFPQWLNTEIYFKQKITREQLVSQIGETLLGWQQTNLHEALENGLKQLLKNGFIQVKDKALIPTEFGVLTARQNQSPAAAVFWDHFCKTVQVENKTPQEIENLLLKQCACSPEYEDIVPQPDELEKLLLLRRSNNVYYDLSLSQTKVLSGLNERLSGELRGANSICISRAVEHLSYLSKLAFLRKKTVVGIIANDLSMRLEFGIPQRGCGAILHLLRDAFSCIDDKKEILEKYRILQEMGISGVEKLRQAIPELSRRIKNFRYLNNAIHRLPRLDGIEIPSPQVGGTGLRGIIKTATAGLEYNCFIKLNDRIFINEFSSPENEKGAFSLDFLPAPNPVTATQGKKKIFVEVIAWNEDGWTWFTKSVEVEVKRSEELEKSVNQILARIEKREEPVAEKRKRVRLKKKQKYKKGQKEFYLNFCDFDSELLKILVKNLLNFVEDKYQKVGTICEFVLSRVRIVEQEETVPQPALQTLGKREGTPDDVALLILGLIKAAGLECDLTGGVFQDGRVCFLPAVELAGEWYQVDLFKNAASAIEVFDFGAGRKYKQDNFSLKEFFSRSPTPSAIHPWRKEYLEPAVKEIKKEFATATAGPISRDKSDTEIYQVKTLCGKIQLDETELGKIKTALDELRRKLQSQKKDFQKWKETIKVEKAEETAEIKQRENQEIKEIKSTEQAIQRAEEKITRVNDQIKDLINFVSCSCCGQKNPRGAYFCQQCGSCLEP